MGSDLRTLLIIPFILYVVSGLYSQVPEPFGITHFDNPSPGYILLDAASDSLLSLYDNSGNAAYYRNMGSIDSKITATRILENGKLAFFGKTSEQWYISDEDFNIIDSVRATNSYVTNFHTLHVSPSGNFLLLATDTTFIDLSGVVPGGRSRVMLFNLVIQEFDVNKNLVFEWDCYENIDVRQATADIDLTGETLDPYHINQVIYDSDGNILVNFRNLDAIYKINRTNGNIIWVMGGTSSRRNDFAFTNDTYFNFYGFSHQHDPKRLPNGNILLFDNGNLKPMRASRAVEYQIDETAMTATKVWEFFHPDSVFAQFMGNAQRLPNGNTIIGWGVDLVNPNPIIATETQSNGNISFEMNRMLLEGNYQALRFIYKMDAVGLNLNGQGNYSFNNQDNTTGIIVNATSVTGAGYASIEKHYYKPYNMTFDIGLVCTVLPFRWVMHSKPVSSVSGKIIFEMNTLPAIRIMSDVDVFYRSIENTGAFTKISSSYNSTQNRIEADCKGMGEYVLGIIEKKSPDLEFPIHRAFNQTVDIKLSWYENLEDDLYIVQVSPYENFGILIADTGNVQVPYIGLEGLEHNKTYYWRVKTYNDNCESQWSRTRIFTTVLAAPDLLYPLNSMKEIPLKGSFRWSPVSGAVKYRLIVSDSTDFSDLLIDKIISNMTFLDYAELEYGRKYYWKVVANSYGKYDNWSPVWQFDTYFGKPSLISPADKENYVPVTGTLNWNLLTNAVSYHIQFGSDSLFGENIIDTIIGNVPQIEYGKLKNRGKYFWRIRASNGESYSDWSDTWSFSAIFPPPVLRLPTNNQAKLPPSGSLIWESVPGAEIYEVQLSNNTEFTNYVINQMSVTFSLAYENLKFETRYYWRVRAIYGQYRSEWSDIWSFVIQPEGTLSSPVVIYPENGQYKTAVKPNIRWLPSYQAEFYDIQISTDVEFTTITYDYFDVSATNLITGYLDYDQFYYVRIRSKNQKFISDWTEPLLFTTALPEPKVIYPLEKDTMNSINFIFKWDRVEKARRYYLQVAEDTGFTKLVIDKPNLEQTSFDFSDMLEGVYYYWRVAAFSDNNSSEWTETIKLKLTLNLSVDNNKDVLFAVKVLPNPAVSDFTAIFKIYKKAFYAIDVLNSLGELVFVIDRGNFDTGDYRYSLNCSFVPAGTYFIRFKNGRSQMLYKFQIVK